MTSKNELQIAFRGALKELESTIYDLNDEQFFYKAEENKWSTAETIQHLILSVNPINLALSMPLVLLKVFGSTKHNSSYDDIVALYQKELSEGAKASLPFIPRGNSTNGDKTQMLNSLSKAYQKLINLFGELSENQLDEYFLPHPILGKLSIREMLYFTLYHIRHHHEIIKR